MKYKLLIFIISIVLFFNCDIDASDSQGDIKAINSFLQVKIPGHLRSSKIFIVVIYNCEYVMFSVSSRGYLSHKGNCKFCIKRRNK